MKRRIILVTALCLLAACNSSKPLENSNAYVVGAFSSQENGKINFNNIEVIGEKCNEVEKDKLAECTVERVNLELGLDTNFNENGGVIDGIVSGIIPNEYTVKKGSTVSLTGKFNLKMGTVGLGIKSWRLSKMEFKKI